MRDNTPGLEQDCMWEYATGDGEEIGIIIRIIRLG